MLKIVDAQAVDVAVIADALLGEVGTQVGTVGAYALAELCQREAVLQIELGGHAVFVEQVADIRRDGQVEESALSGSLIVSSRFISDGEFVVGDEFIVLNKLVLNGLLVDGMVTFLAVVEPLSLPRVPGDEWWSAVGSLDLADSERKVCSIRLSRRIPVADHAAVVSRLMTAVDKGYVLAGTFISPCEREVARALVERGAPMIRAVPDQLAMVYRPKGDEPRQFAEGRLLLLSRVAAPGSSRYDAWHGINDALADFATRGSGVSLYVTSARDFRFRPRLKSAIS